MPEANTARSSAPCTPHPAPLTLHPSLIPEVTPQTDLQAHPTSRWLWSPGQVALPLCSSVSPPAKWGCRWELPPSLLGVLLRSIVCFWRTHCVLGTFLYHPVQPSASPRSWAFAQAPCPSEEADVDVEEVTW